ncbi:KH domain-containing protein At5g56140 isoform X1 [Selaginella moellendorffii]|uniref:KH domain-containing protein At5g56140 isoform X1 n=1 Tax=Selaginella moellendorffii TaxID=88036 RepID=UPI000D1C3E4E|nr:KH domain-containing protein At5g56140 isoform X1 [Selaginella moellendorffii]|eukprot:XP_024540332.1 KH domain-containing protein At5g56140 isoform X1 [Selaginella moellendorffii]
MSGRSYMHYSPSSASTGSLSPQIGGLGRSPNALLEHDKYFTELLMEQESLRPFMMVLPHCSFLLNQEILRVSKLIGQSQLLDQDTLDMGSPLGLISNGGSRDLNAWAAMQHERTVLPLWHGSPAGSPGPIIKKTLRIEIPTDDYPNFNFVGRLLGPRGLSLKRVENETGCRVMIRGRGSIKDAAKEEKMRDKPGYEHLNEPLHVLVEAELPANQIDTHLQYAQEIIEDVLRPPPDESVDAVKKAQLRELAMLNGTLREDSPYLTGSLTSFNNPGMKRPKIRR